MVGKRGKVKGHGREQGAKLKLIEHSLVYCEEKDGGLTRKSKNGGSLVW